jgi:hypothetical protein
MLVAVGAVLPQAAAEYIRRLAALPRSQEKPSPKAGPGVGAAR